MDPRRWAQDVLRCRSCETPAPPLYCELCKTHLCAECREKHLLDKSKEHKVISFEKRGSKCEKHSTKICELYCKNCENPVCILCVSSDTHNAHDVVNILNILESSKCRILEDLNELEKSIHPTYQRIASNIQVQKENLNENVQKLKTTLDKHGEDLHRKIDTVIKEKKTGLDDMNSKHLKVLTKQENEITFSISKITETIADLRKLLNCNQIKQISSYKSKNSEFRRLPPKLTISLPKFSPAKFQNLQMYQQLDFIFNTAPTIKTEKRGYSMDYLESSPLDRHLIDVPHIVSDLNTDYGGLRELRSVSCLNEDELWTSGDDSIIRLYNLKKELLKSIQTKSGDRPWDITVTENGNLVYTDPNSRTVNILKNTQIQEVIRLRGWRPHGVCSTASGDLLVIMHKDDGEQTRVVRYSGSTERQSIQFDKRGYPLFSTGKFNNFKYVRENKNLDICVSDNKAGAVVVVNKVGKLRFIYTGPLSTTKRSFYPAGITTDSLSRILIVDWDNKCIHILDQDGQFLRYIDNCDLWGPWGLCVDARDNLFVAEWWRGEVKKIKYTS